MKRSFVYLIAGMLLAGPAMAQQKLEKFPFRLNWTLYGEHAPFFVARDKGFYAQEGLEVEIQEFTQVFSAKETSEARIELRAWLGAGVSRAAFSRGWSVVEPNAGADAVSGAAAFARAADRVVGELGGWIAAQPDCR